MSVPHGGNNDNAGYHRVAGFTAAFFDTRRLLGRDVIDTTLRGTTGAAILVIAILSTILMESVALADPQLVEAKVKNQDAKNRVFGIGDTIRIEIRGLAAWRSGKTALQRELVLYIDGVPFKGAELSSAEADYAEFQLDRKPGDDDRKISWNRLLAHPNTFVRDVQIAVSPKDQPPFPLAEGESSAGASHLSLRVLWDWVFGFTWFCWRPSCG